MNKDNTYLKWIHQRRQVNPPDNFAGQVMNEIKAQQPDEGLSLFDLVSTPSHLLARWAAALGLIAMGIFRIAFVTSNLLFGSML